MKRLKQVMVVAVWAVLILLVTNAGTLFTAFGSSELQIRFRASRKMFT